MDNNELKIIKDTQEAVEQMRIADLEEDPTLEEEMFECSCCGKTKSLAGSIQYGKYRLCNDCVLIAETGFALKRFENIQDLIDATEEKRLEEICEYIKTQENNLLN